MSACPCGCGHTVRDGNTYAKPYCYARLSRRTPGVSVRVDLHSILTRRALQESHHATASWWIGAPREAWPRVVQREQPRMSLTLFGRMDTRILCATNDPALRTRALPIGDGA